MVKVKVKVKAIAIAALVTALCACKRGEPEAEAGDAPPAAQSATPDAADPTEGAASAGDAKDDPTGPFAWLDPNANGVAWVDLPDDLSPAAIAAVFALPPRATALLDAPHEIDEALAAVTGAEDLPDAWFSGPALVSTSMLTSGPYVVRSLSKPRSEIAAALARAGFQSSTTEGFEIWQPQRAFPWRVVLLDAETVAFVPMREPGSGLTPLTAGRDLPPSDLERELARAIAEDTTLRVALYAAGPMLHFDVQPSMRGARLELRQLPGAGLDGRVLFEPESDASGVVQALSKREVPEENQQIQLLASEVAYQLDGELVLGRLQVPATKIAVLELRD